MERFMQRKAFMFLDEGYYFGKAGEGFERVNIACPSAVLSTALDRFYTALDAEGII
jgi:bifunctional pyridoxal-dependent enzyme with beta-cystathionase and maltose regulon repressor activities